MIVTILLLLLGLSLIIFGAERFTEGASKLAIRFGIPEFIVGLTIVAIGTSAPELVVTIISSAKGNPDIAVGNVVGSNIFNSFMIMGVTALIIPVRLTRSNIRKDIPYGVAAALVLLFVASDKIFDGSPINIISRSEGLTLIVMYIVFTAYTIFSSGKPVRALFRKEDVAKPKLFTSLLYIFGGGAMLVYGGTLFLDNAVVIAKGLGMTDKQIAVTLMSGGTSFPELATCVAAALKRRGGMALGNVIGSNISNVFLILGVGSTITPLAVQGITVVDLLTSLFGAVLLLVAAYTFKGYKINRFEGGVMALCYIAYVTYSLI